MRKSWVSLVLGALTVGGWSAAGVGTAAAQQVCAAASLGGGEVCLYSGPFLTGREFDISVPLGQQLPVPTDGDCVDLPSGFDLTGSVTNTSSDTLYVFGATCPDSRPATRPVTVVVPHHTGNLVPGAGTRARTPIRSVRSCGPGLALDPVALRCAYLR